MNKGIIGVLTVCLYGFPVVYFSMQLDFSSRSMLGYLMMIAVTSLLAYIGKAFSHTAAVIAGNLLSAAVSFYFISRMNGSERWDVYFQPLTPYLMLFFVSALNVIPQFLAMRLAVRAKKPR